MQHLRRLPGRGENYPGIEIVNPVRQRLSGEHSLEFIESVLALNPDIAAFDCDGTLWSGDAGEGFFNWELENHIVSDEVAAWARARYADYRAGKVSEDDMCGEMVTMHKGLNETYVQSAANHFFEEFMAAQIFDEMRALIHKLQDQGCQVWAVSSTNEWMIRAGMRPFDVTPERILAAAVEIENGIITDRLVRIPSGEGKPKAIKSVLSEPPAAAFGNSKWDAAMLQMARHAFAVNPNPDLESIARQRGWRIYYPEA
jgi:HAD superfamily phosphoserine phosphatase-like hydrolase